MASTAAIQAWTEAFDDGTWADILVDSLGGEIDNVDADYNAYSHRGATFHMQFNVFWNSTTASPEQEQKCNAWLRKVYDTAGVDGSVSDSAYRNYPNERLEDYAGKYYGAHYPQLQQIKALYDPEDYFTYSQSIKLPTE